MDDMWDQIPTPEVITSTAAQSKRPDVAPVTQQPMQAGIKPANRRRPTADQRKVRRQMNLNKSAVRNNYRTEDQGMSGRVTVAASCISCGVETSATVTPAALAAFEGGAMVQTAFPELSEDVREAIFISGICPTCYDRMFTHEGAHRMTQPIQPTETELSARLAAATTMAEQSDLTRQIEALRNARRDTLASEASLDWDMGATPMTRLEVAAAAVMGETAPALTASASMGTTDATDWLMGVDTTPTPDVSMTHMAKAAALEWYAAADSSLKGDRQEFTAQAQNAAGRTGSQFGAQSQRAESVFLSQVSHLASKEGVAIGAPSQSAPKTASPYLIEFSEGRTEIFDKDDLMGATYRPGPKTSVREYTNAEDYYSMEGPRPEDWDARQFFRSSGFPNLKALAEGGFTPAASDILDSAYSEVMKGNAIEDITEQDVREASTRTASIKTATYDCGYCGGSGTVADGAGGMDLGVGGYLDCPICKGKGQVGSARDRDRKPYFMSSRKTAIHLTEVGISGPGVGVGTKADGTRVQFHITEQEEADLKSVLYFDMAVNFSGVSIEESDILTEQGGSNPMQASRTSARKTAWGEIMPPGSVRITDRPDKNGRIDVDQIFSPTMIVTVWQGYDMVEAMRQAVAAVNKAQAEWPDEFPNAEIYQNGVRHEASRRTATRTSPGFEPATQFTPCANHKMFFMNDRSRVMTFVTEGGPTDDVPCATKPCLLIPGREFYPESRNEAAGRDIVAQWDVNKGKVASGRTAADIDLMNPAPEGEAPEASFDGEVEVGTPSGESFDDDTLNATASRMLGTPRTASSDWTVGTRLTRNGKTFEIVRIRPAGAQGTRESDGPTYSAQIVQEDGTVDPRGFVADIWSGSMTYPSSAYTKVASAPRPEATPLGRAQASLRALTSAFDSPPWPMAPKVSPIDGPVMGAACAKCGSTSITMEGAPGRSLDLYTIIHCHDCGNSTRYDSGPRPGWRGAKVAAETSRCSAPGDNHSEDLIEKWTGRPEPTYLCGYHEMRSRTDFDRPHDMQSLAADSGGQTCSQCGDKVAKDPDGTYHHDNGEKHDHGAKVAGRKTSSAYDLGEEDGLDGVPPNPINPDHPGYVETYTMGYQWGLKQRAEREGTTAGRRTAEQVSLNWKRVIDAGISREELMASVPSAQMNSALDYWSKSRSATASKREAFNWPGAGRFIPMQQVTEEANRALSEGRPLPVWNHTDPEGNRGPEGHVWLEYNLTTENAEGTL